jgi:hypothetical protein
MTLAVYPPRSGMGDGKKQAGFMELKLGIDKRSINEVKAFD